MRIDAGESILKIYNWWKRNIENTWVQRTSTLKVSAEQQDVHRKDDLMGKTGAIKSEGLDYISSVPTVALRNPKEVSHPLDPLPVKSERVLMR